MKKKRNILLQACLTGLGVATGRLIVDLWLDPKPTYEVIQFAGISFCAGVFGSFPIWMIGKVFKKKERQAIEQMHAEVQSEGAPSD